MNKKLDYTTEFEMINGTRRSLKHYEGRVLLIVNTASMCGLTPQLEGLELLHSAFGPQGLSVLSFPCNQFMSQEPGSPDEIESCYSSRYGVSFDICARIEVNGPDAHPLFLQLKDAAPGLMGKGIKWNFTKFLVGRDGSVIKRYGPQKAPETLQKVIVKALAN